MRIVNYGSAINITLVLEDVIVPSSVDIVVLEGETGDDYEQNTPWNPTEISPRQYTTQYSIDTPFLLNANTFTIFSFAGITKK